MRFLNLFQMIAVDFVVLTVSRKKNASLCGVFIKIGIEIRILYNNGKA